MPVATLPPDKAAMVEQARAIMDRAELLGRFLTPDEEAQFDSLAVAIEAQDDEDRRRAMAARRDALTLYQTHLDALPPPRTLPAMGREAGLLPHMLGASSRSYAALFGLPRRSPWRAGEFLATLQRDLNDERLEPFAAMSEGQGSAGGFLVPQELAATLLDGALHNEIVRPRADVTPMLSRTKMVAGYDGIDQSSGLYGFTFAWLAENASMPSSIGNVRGILLTAHPGGIYLPVSNELWADAGGMDFENALEARIIAAIAENLDHYYLNGTGANQPLGVLKSGSLLVVAPEAGQGAATLEAENITGMYRSSSNPNGSVWVCSPSCIPGLLGLVYAPMSSLPLVQQGADGTMSMLGRPLLTTAQMPVLGQQGDVLFADFSAYQIGLRQEVSLEKSRDAGFQSNQTHYRAIIRTDGQSKSSRVFTGRDGQSYAPFVVLGARS